MSYFLNITDGEGVLLGRIVLDGLRLDQLADQQLVGELVKDGMGAIAIRDCAGLPIPQEA